MSPNAPQSVGFRYKKTSELGWQNVLYTEGIASSKGSFSVTIDNLSPDTTYDFEAYMSVWTGSSYQEIAKSGQFTTNRQVELQPAGLSFRLTAAMKT